MNGVTDGARTRDNLSHSQGLYQLSYSHHRDLYLTKLLLQLPASLPATLSHQQL
jgi:hypothetical protein